MGQHLHKSSLILRHGSRMIFVLREDQENTRVAFFVDHHKRVIDVRSEDATQRSIWFFDAPMPILGCFYIASFIGETFGLKVRESVETENPTGLAFVYWHHASNYSPPVEINMNRDRHELAITLRDHDIITARLKGLPAGSKNLANAAGIVGALHGLERLPNEPDASIWRKPGYEPKTP